MPFKNYLYLLICIVMAGCSKNAMNDQSLLSISINNCDACIKENQVIEVDQPYLLGININKGEAELNTIRVLLEGMSIEQERSFSLEDRQQTSLEKQWPILLDTAVMNAIQDKKKLTMKVIIIDEMGQESQATMLVQLK